MNMANWMRKILFGDGSNISQRTYITNFCASLMYSVQSALLLLVVTRVGGLYQAGIFSIIYTVTQTLASLGSYSMRSFQVSDVKNEYSFKNYYSSRMVTCSLMMAACFVYAIVKGLAWEQLLIVLLFGFYRAIDGMEDVYHGLVQKEGRLDVASIAMLIRIVISVIMFVSAYFLSGNLLLASVALAATSAAVYFFCCYILKQEYRALKVKFGTAKVWALLRTCFPIFAGAILYNYLVNVPKYSIDRVLNEETQTIFNILFMPIFVINVLSSMVFKPMIVYMSVWWEEGQIKKVVFAVLKQCMIILALTAGVAVCGYLFGTQVLGWIYGVELTKYRLLFMILLLLGGISALGTFFSVILTIMRRQLFIILGYLSAFFSSVFFIDRIVDAWGIYGAGAGYGLVMSIATVFFTICMIANTILYQRKREDGRGGEG